MIRLLGFLLQVTLLVALAVWLASTPGQVRLEVADWIIETSLAVVIAALFAAGFLLLALSAVWRFVRHGPAGWRLRQKIRRLEEDRALLEAGFAAIAAGDKPLSRKLAHTIRQRMPDQPLALLLRAQAARLAGDRAGAEAYYAALSEDPRTSIIGWRGLITQALQNNDLQESARLVQRAAAKDPGAPWLRELRLEQEARARNWSDALAALQELQRLKRLPPEDLQRKEGALLLALGRQALEQGAPDGARTKAERALKLHGPHRAAASALLAEAMLAQGDTRSAEKTLLKAWSDTPDTQLLPVWKQVTHGLPALEILRRTEKLVERAPHHRASALARADAALAADLWGEARRALTPLLNDAPEDRAALLLLAEIEAREYPGGTAAQSVLQRAAHAPERFGWRCGACQGTTTHWLPLCPHCHGFATLTAEDSAATTEASKARLRLLR